jgi:hypothetical protein
VEHVVADDRADGAKGAACEAMAMDRGFIDRNADLGNESGLAGGGGHFE